MRKSCEGCIHYKRLYMGDSEPPLMACHYLLDTNKIRPCSAENCTVKEVLHENIHKRTHIKIS